jgi:hypothetical protein
VLGGGGEDTLAGGGEDTLAGGGEVGFSLRSLGLRFTEACAAP